MLIKEYRICMPMHVEEYRIGQLYMIMKKSREESEGVDSGVEIIKNEPYTEGPGGHGGQYTFKLYHVGKHLPSWLRSLFPKSALSVYEEAWNAYPYTMTRFRTPFMEKFQLDIESRYYNDCGNQENVFSLTPEELRQREIVYIDIVRDQISDSHAEEDPKVYKSEKTGRGPLGDNWRQEHLQEQEADAARSSNGIAPPSVNRKRIMCAYKLCRVEFRYWGMQTRVENFVSEYALRKTLIRAHRQAWCWQDEYIDLSIEDIRRLESEVQQILAAKMKRSSEEKSAAEGLNNNGTNETVVISAESSDAVVTSGDCANMQSGAQTAAVITSHESVVSASAAYVTISSSVASSSQENLTGLPVDRHWSLDDEFFDAEEDFSPPTPTLSNSNNEGSGNFLSLSQQPNHGDGAAVLFIVLLSDSQNDDLTASLGASLSLSTGATFATFTATLTQTACRFAIENTLAKRSLLKLFLCPNVAMEIDHALSPLSPLKFSAMADATGSNISAFLNNSMFSSMFAASSLLLATSELAAKSLENAVTALITFTKNAVAECKAKFPECQSPVEVCFIADSHSSIVLYEALIRWPANFDHNSDSSQPRRRSSSNPNIIPIRRFPNRTSFQSYYAISGQEVESGPKPSATHADFSSIPVTLTVPESTKQETESCNNYENTHSFVPKQCFFIGSPLGLVLAHRMHCCAPEIFQPNCLQVYNVFYEIDPLASRIEPLLMHQLASEPPAPLPRVHSWTWSHPDYCIKNTLKRHGSQIDSANADADSDIVGFWGTKRVDYLLNCSQAEFSSRGGIFRGMPHGGLVQILQASYWENKDLAAFVLQEVFGKNSQNDRHSPQFDRLNTRSEATKDEPDSSPRRVVYEKWLRPHRLFKLRRPVQNHHASDVIVSDSVEKITIRGRMAYGAFDMIDLNGERVDCHVEFGSSVNGAQTRTWHFVDTSITDENGRVSFTFSPHAFEKVGASASSGFYRALLVVRGDHTIASLTIAMLPPSSKVALFSIDGSFSASLSLSGANPRLHPGCVEVVRHWAQAGYIIFYVSSRPDSQQNQVVSWLARHNFPLGLMAFPSTGITSEPFRSKAAYIRQVVSEANLDIAGAYGSAKDISVYTQAGIDNKRIFIVGREKRAHSSHHPSNAVSVNWISDGYAEHLRWLVASGFASFAPIQQWSLLRPWWSNGMSAEDTLSSLSSQNASSLADGVGSVLALPPALPSPRSTGANVAGQHRCISVAKELTNGHTAVRSVAPNETNN